MKTTRQLFTGIWSRLMVLAPLLTLGNIAAQNCANDNTPPSIFCVDLNTTFMPDVCMVEIWAKDFIYKASNNPDGTGGDAGITYSFDANTDVPNRIFFSDEGFLRNVRVYVRDSCGNTTFCDVELSIDDNTGDCPSPGICDVDINPWCGYAVVTCSAALPGDAIATIIDVRTNETAPRGDNWTRPVTPGATPVPILRPAAWTLGAIGMVYGLAINPRVGEIFLAASDIYAYDFQSFVSVGFPPPSCSGPAGPAGIYKSLFNTNPAAITAAPFVVTDTIAMPGNVFPTNAQIIGTNRIPNTGNTRECNVVTREELLNRPRTGNGIGNIAYDKVSNHLFATNLEDGRIYSINSQTGIITDIFDPFAPYNHTVDGRGLVDSTERIWGIQVMNCDRPVKVIFARENAGPGVDNLTNRPKNIYSVTVDRDGRFIENDGAESLLFTLEIGRQKKITDFAFNGSCDRLLIAERGDDHKSRVFEFVFQGGAWRFDKRIFVGINDESAPAQEDGIIYGSSGSGGVSYGPRGNRSRGDIECDDMIWATMNCGDVVADPGRCDVYGLQGVDGSGNVRQTSGATDIFIDFDSSFTSNPLNFKSNIGEVEIFNCCCIEEEGRHVLSTSVSAIIGNMATASAARMSNVAVQLTTSNINKRSISSAEGMYSFNDLDMNQEYMIVPKKTDNVGDGLTTLDLILIQQHILGLRKIQSPYDLIAADVNASQTITSADLVDLRRVILGVKDNFDKNDSWVFVPKSLDMQSLANPLKYEAYLMIQTESSTIDNADFVGIKVGDINGDNRISAGATVRSSDVFNIEIVKGHANGNRREFIVKALSDMVLRGMQMNFEGILPEALRLQPGSLELSADHYNMIDDQMVLSWTAANGQSIKKGDILFTLQADVDDQVRLVNSALRSEAYSSTLERVDINEMYSEISLTNEHVSIYPNPFSETTILSLQLTESQNISVSIMSQDGKLIHQYNLLNQSGLVQLDINREGQMSHAPSGLYFVRIKLANELITKKIIKLD